jgi:hypothetical protein
MILRGAEYRLTLSKATGANLWRITAEERRVGYGWKTLHGWTLVSLHDASLSGIIASLNAHSTPGLGRGGCPICGAVQEAMPGV